MKELLQTSPSILESVSTDFGRIFEATPLAYYAATDTPTLLALVQYCNKHNIPIIPKGMSHSASGQSLCPKGVVIDMRQKNSILNIDFDGNHGTIHVEAGASWESVVRACLVHGAAPEVLTDWQKLSVGGTLSTGGIGFMSYCKGIQADIIESLEVITGDGRLLHCSQKEYPDLFRLVKGGLGMYGIIVSARLRIVKAPKKIHIQKSFISDTLIFEEVMNKVQNEMYYDCVHSFLIPNEIKIWKKHFGVEFSEQHKAYCLGLPSEGFGYFVEVVKYTYDLDSIEQVHQIDMDLSCTEVIDFIDFIMREPPLIKTEANKGPTAHPELAVFVPKLTFQDFMNYLLERHHSADMGEGPVLIIPMTSEIIQDSAFTCPQEDFYFIGILRNAFPNTQEHIEKLIALNEDLYHYSLSLGAKRYPCDSLSFPNTSLEWKAHFGEARWQFVQKGKQTYDKNNTLKSLLTLHQT